MTLVNFLKKVCEANEEKDKNKQKIDIQDPKKMYKNIVKRLAYLKYLIDDKENSDNVDKLQKIYDVLKDLVFFKGELRSLEDIIKHTKSIQKENNGKIPNLPADKILKSLDMKMIKFENYDKDTLDEYIGKIEKDLHITKADSESKSDSDQILNAEPSKKDNIKSEELVVDLEMIEDFNKGFCRALCIIDITSGISVDKPHVPDEPDEEDQETDLETGGDEDKDEDEDIENPLDSEEDEDKKELVNQVAELVDAYIDNYDGDDYDEDDIDEWLKASEILDKIDDEKKRDEFSQAFKDSVKKELDANEDEEKVEESFNGNSLLLEYTKDNNRATMSDRIKAIPRRTLRTAWNVSKFLTKVSIVTAMPLIGGVLLYRRHKKKVAIKNMAKGLKAQLETEKDPKKKEELQAHYDKVMLTCFDSNGNPRHRPKLNKLDQKDRVEFATEFGKNISDESLKAAGKASPFKKGDLAKDKIVAKKHAKIDKKYDKAIDKGAETNKDGYVEKEETIKDPKTGEKIKVKTYTGSRGGKFYYPEGKPKKPENRVYLESLTLSQFMYELFY